MAKNHKRPQLTATHSVTLGKERSEKINRFRAKLEMSGQVRPTIAEAVNILVDKALAADGITSELQPQTV